MTAHPEILAVGEAMALIAPAEAVPFADAGDFRVDAAGAEVNVASHLAALGRRAAWAGALGADAVGARIVRQLGERSVGTQWIVTDPAAQTGVYLKDPGAGVAYYRRRSAFSRLGADFVATLPMQAEVVHTTGITPALSPSCAALVDELFRVARGAGALLSFDVNVRLALWPDAATAAERLLRLAAQADVVFVGRDEAEALWGARDAGAVRALLPAPRHVIVKDGGIEATEFDGTRAVAAPVPPLVPVEAVGAGDAFAAAWLDGRLQGMDAAARLRAGHRRAAQTMADTADFPR